MTLNGGWRSALNLPVMYQRRHNGQLIARPAPLNFAQLRREMHVLASAWIGQGSGIGIAVGIAIGVGIGIAVWIGLRQ